MRNKGPYTSHARCIRTLACCVLVAMAPVALSCCESKDCKSSACDDYYGPVTVDVVVGSDIDPSISDLIITVETDASSTVFSCHRASLQDLLICDASSNGPVSVQSTGAVGNFVPGQTILTLDLGTPNTVSIHISGNGVEVASESFMPNYDAVFDPYGPDCPGRPCHRVDYPSTLTI